MRAISILSRSRKTHKLFPAILLLLLLGGYLPSSFFRHPMRPDEVRNLSVAQDLRAGKELFLLHYAGKPYYQKPPFYYWVIRPFLATDRDPCLWPLVLINVLCAWGVALCCYRMARWEGDAAQACVGAGVFVCLPLVYAATIIIRMDILFLLFISASLASFYEGHERNNLRLLALSAACVFLAVFTKGAYGLLLPFVTGLLFACWTRDQRALRRIVAVTFCAGGLIAAWLFAMERWVDHAYLRMMLGTQTIDRAIAPQDHKEGWWYYFPYALLVFLPWMVFALARLKERWGVYTRYERFLVAWLAGGFALLSMTGSKLFLYLLIVAPPVALLAGAFLHEHAQSRTVRWTFLCCAGALVAAGGVAFIYLRKEALSGAGQLITVLGLVVMIGVWSGWRNVSRVQKAVATFALLCTMINMGYLPLISQNRSLKELAGVIRAGRYPVRRIYVDSEILTTLRLYIRDIPISLCDDTGSLSLGEGALFIGRQVPGENGLVRVLGTSGKYTVWYNAMER